MLGTIIGTNDNQVLLKLNINLNESGSLVNHYVIMEYETQKIIGEIIDIKDNIAYINLLGELVNNSFIPGVIKKPSFSSNVNLVSTDVVPFLISTPTNEENRQLYIGNSSVYDDLPIKVDINSFFSNHFAIFGATGSGKSCAVAKIMQNLFEKQQFIAYNACIFIFDAYGEYHNAFKDINNKVPEINFKAYTTDIKASDAEILRIPLWLLDVDDIAILLGANKHSQLPIIEKALKLVTIFGQEESLVIKHKNNIIARAILDILTSGNLPVQIRDQIFSILSYYNTSELNLETTVYQPGYARSLKQCLIIDNDGKIREMELLTTFFEQFTADSLQLNLPDGTFKYTLKNLVDAFDFALISEGVLKSDKVYDEANVLKVRLHAIYNSDKSHYFDFDEYVSKPQYIKNLVTTRDGRRAQIINFNINAVDDRFAKIITKIYSKILFTYAKELEPRASVPFHILLEEAHRYVQNDTDINLIGYNIFDRIAKEGRKYGVILGLITQRPSEMSSTTLSQCNNFIIFKMQHPTDINYIREMVPNITEDTVKKLRSLPPGNCIAFGLAFKIPVFIKLSMPNPLPSSSSCNVSGIWFLSRK